MKNILVHIGIHKTGTTLLQKHLFCNPDYGYTLWPDRKTIHSKLVALPPFASVAADFREELIDYAKKSAEGGCQFVVSHERLAGYPGSGGYDVRILAERLKELYPKAKIFIVIREQKALIYSFYCQFIKDGASVSLSRFLCPPEPEIRRFPYFDLGFYEFDRVIAYYFSLFGSHNVLELPYEMLKRETEKFVKKIMRFSGVPDEKAYSAAETFQAVTVNPRMSISQLSLMRILNSLFYRNQCGNFALAHFSDVPQVTRLLTPVLTALTPTLVNNYTLHLAYKRIENYVGTYYNHSNRRTSALIEVDLSEYGYVM